MSAVAVAARAVCAASADLGPDDARRADPGADGLAKPGADGHADPGSDGLAESGAGGRADPGADGRAARYAILDRFSSRTKLSSQHKQLSQNRTFCWKAKLLHATSDAKSNLRWKVKLLGQRTMLLKFSVKKIRVASLRCIFEGTILRRF